jgi:hypothetical protein
MMAKKPEQKQIMCPGCAKLLEVEPQHDRAVVVACSEKGWTGPLGQWGSANTRINIGELRIGDGKTMPAHAIQLDPPPEKDEEPRAAVDSDFEPQAESAS